MKKWHLIIDVEKCEDCNNCFLACKDEHVGNDWPGYTLAQPLHGQRWMNIERRERGQYPLIDAAYRPTPCMQCSNPPCVKAGKGSISQRPDGIVQIDPVKAKGLKEVVKACPYNAIYWNEELQVPQKCTFCAHLLDEGWKQPRCVQACPTGALRAEQVEESLLNDLIESQQLEVLHPEWGTHPAVYYKNLYRFNKCFLAGSVARMHNGAEDCVQGARVKLFRDSQQLCETETDAFGDFKIDRLEENSGKYRLEIEFEGSSKRIEDIEFQASLNLGVINL
ncbi:Fe-S-cluster-containing hydrogenase subunit [Desulfosporosinus orientis DSM 765]|uniref:Fe-S-cluster-containing hydrogenase subunit n=1 Tax=Desulfosporosinus orientis (strain ATCC 19365 / DSM 765 / NCIMB 8382 / VKM B-1628 / Singapore I) TaxID=768706 RepID=G7WDH7_DESOD|nr:4Fe-4S dicluster domain-containing protein [Desulfosporosinus orientis]AET67946.1 Fe-S-cluster-containing hydrogenase subunit [Desulfosporosinus orientis DSM 765]